jgi:hypothetical protein
MSNIGFQEFEVVVKSEVDRFPSVQLLKKVEAGTLSMEDYHQYLKIVFHQSFNAPASFALAGGSCPPNRYEVRDYFIKHAEEERKHWQWVLGDLEKTGYRGPDLRSSLPSPRVSAYIAFNFFVAQRYPIARLANAAVLECIGATHAKRYAKMICDLLKLTKDQVFFTYGHSDTDIGHTEDIFNILKGNVSDEIEWKWLIHAAQTSALLYRDMYNET